VSDERRVVQGGLRRLIDREPRWAEWPVETLRGRFLDEVGSDHKPLVLLLLRVHDLGIPQRLPPVVIDAGHWERARTTLAQRLTNELFLQPEMAAWAVESWAWALHVIGEEFLLDPPSVAPTVSTSAAPARTGGGRTGSSGARTTGGGRTTASPAVRGAAAPMRSTAPPMRTTAGTGLRSTGPLGNGPPEWLVRAAYISIPVCYGGWLLFIGVQMARGGRTEPAPTPTQQVAVAAAPMPAPVVSPVPGAEPSAALRPALGSPLADPSRPALNPVVQPSGNTTPSGAPTSTNQPLAADPLPGVTRSALPMTAADSAKSMAATPPRRAGTGTELAPRNPLSAAGGLDQVTTTDGRVMTGRVEVIRAGSILFKDQATGLRYELPKRQVVQVLTEFGTIVRFDGGETVAASPLVKKGVGGPYRVSYRINEVTGTAECQSLWKSAAPPDADAEVRHIPGADTLQLAFKGGATFNAVMDQEARFTSTFVIVPDQALTASAVTSRIRGTFSATGFSGQVTLIGFRRARPGSGLTDTACQSVLDVNATRLKAPAR
jgi:hypothetical protein